MQHTFTRIAQAVWLTAGLFTASAALAAGGGAGTGKKATESTNDYEYYLTGSAANQTPSAAKEQMLVLMGGGEDVDDAFRDMFRQAGCDVNSSAGKPLDVVVIRTSGADGYNPYLFQLGARPSGVGCVDSVETLVIKTRAGADLSKVVERVANADVLFIAGGDQSTYIKLWQGSKLDQAIGGLLAKKVPLGGTSAGLAVLGGVDYTGENGSITSSEALSNPYNKKLTLSTTFLNALPNLQHTVTDSHLVERDRLGRLITFMARMGQDNIGANWSNARAIGVPEATALVVVDQRASVRFQDTPSASSHQNVYFLNWTASAETGVTVQAKQPLQFQAGYLQLQRLPACEGCSFDLGSWTGSTQRYWPQVIQGTLSGAPF